METERKKSVGGKPVTKKSGVEHPGSQNAAVTKSVEKSAYEQKSESRLEEVRDKLTSVVGKIEQAVADGRMEVGDQLESAVRRLKTQIDGMERRLGRLKAAGEESWGDVESSLENAWEDLAQSIRNILKRVS